MTIRLLDNSTAYGVAGDIVTLQSAEETALIDGGLASATLTGGAVRMRKFPPLEGSIIGAIGDSTVFQMISDPADTSTRYYTARGTIPYLQSITGGRVRYPYTHIQGVSSQTSAQILARVPAFVRLSPKMHFAQVQAGINDVLGGLGVDAVVNNLIRIAGAIKAAGIVPIMVPIPPCRGFDAAQATLARQINNQFVRWARNEGGIVVPSIARLIDPATGLGIASFFNADGVHFYPPAARILAQAINAAAGHLFNTVPLSSSAAMFRERLAPIWSADNTLNAISVNPFMVGLGGVAGTGGAAASGSGTTTSIATGWRLERSGTGVGTITGSKVQRWDGMGEAMRLTIASDGTGSSTTDEVFYMRPSAGATTTLGYFPGLQVFAYALIKIGAPSTAGLLSYVEPQFRNNGGTTVDVGAMTGAAEWTWHDTEEVMTLFSPVFTVPTGATGFNARLRTEINASISGNVVIDVAEFGIVPALREY